jgi:branched-chain amino acid transport system permease protein
VLKNVSLKRAGWIAVGLISVTLVGQLIAAFANRNRSTHGLPVPIPFLIQAVEFGAAYALIAVGLVLIYRATRIINFAHAGFGAVASAVFFSLTFVKHWPYPIALVLALASGVAAGGLVELLVIRRFTKSSRLVLTVVTLGVGQLLGAIAVAVALLLAPGVRTATGTPRTPFSRFRWNMFPIVISGNEVVLLVVAALLLAGFAAFLGFSRVGIAIRGSAENEDRASLLGINTNQLSLIVWLVAAGLSAAAAVFQVPVQGFTIGAVTGVIGSGILLRALAGAVVGGMDNLPITVASCIGIAIFERSVFAAYRETSIVDGLLLVLIVGVLLLQRRKLARTDEGSTQSWAATEEIRPIPKELAGVESVRSGVRWLVFVGAALLLGLPWVFSFGQVNSASLFLIYGIIIVSLVVLTGWGGQISLGQFGFVAVGAVAGGALSQAHWPFLAALLFGSLAGAAVAVIIGLPALRIRGLFLAVSTLAFSIAVASVLLNRRYFGSILPETLKRPNLLFIKLDDERAFYYVCLVGLVLTILAAVGVRRSRTGRVLIAMRENERTAQSFGVNLTRTRLATFALSGFIAAFAGVLFAFHSHGVNSESFAPDQSIQIFIMAVIGGLGSVPGSLTGALYFGTLNLLTANPLFRLLASSAGLLVVLMAFPGGLGAAVFKLRDTFLRRVAIRHRIYVPALMGGIGAVHQMAKIVLSPKTNVDGGPARVPRKYRLESRIRHAGDSQQEKRWSA